MGIRLGGWGIGDWIRPGEWIEPGVWGFVQNVPPFWEGGWAFRSFHAGAGGFDDWRGFSNGFRFLGWRREKLGRELQAGDFWGFGAYHFM